MTIPNSVFDAALSKIATGNRVSYCTAEPASVADIANLALITKSITPGDGNGDWVIADGDVSGRKLMLAEQPNMSPSADGTITYMAIDDGTEILATNPVTPQGVLTTQTWTAPATKVLELEDPAYA